MLLSHWITISCYLSYIASNWQLQPTGRILVGVINSFNYGFAALLQKTHVANHTLRQCYTCLCHIQDAKVCLDKGDANFVIRGWKKDSAWMYAWIPICCDSTDLSAPTQQTKRAPTVSPCSLVDYAHKDKYTCVASTVWIILAVVSFIYFFLYI